MSDNTPAVVSVQCADSYDGDALLSAVSRHFEALEIEKEITPNTRVLLKPNLLAGRDPALAVTTHPALLRAIALWLRGKGVQKIVLADSPGGVYTPASLRKVYAACGLTSLCELVELNEDVSASARDGFSLIQPVLDADYIINCPKLKTHGLTVMTAGVKNLFGCIPGLKKPELHCVKSTVDSFAGFLLDLAMAVKPQLTILDAIDCMEGNGPGGGSVRHMGYTLAARSLLSLEEQSALLMGLRPNLSPVLRAARSRGMLDADATLVGDPLVPADPPFLLPDSIIKGERLFTPNGLFHRICGRRGSEPVVRAAQCIGCGHCAQSCPKGLIQIVEKKAVIESKGCISCFCCQEMCPAHAIDAQARRWSRGKRRANQR